MRQLRPRFTGFGFASPRFVTRRRKWDHVRPGRTVGDRPPGDRRFCPVTRQSRRCPIAPSRPAQLNSKSAVRRVPSSGRRVNRGRCPASSSASSRRRCTSRSRCRTAGRNNNSGPRPSATFAWLSRGRRVRAPRRAIVNSRRPRRGARHPPHCVGPADARERREPLGIAAADLPWGATQPPRQRGLVAGVVLHGRVTPASRSTTQSFRPTMLPRAGGLSERTSNRVRTGTDRRRFGCGS